MSYRENSNDMWFCATDTKQEDLVAMLSAHAASEQLQERAGERKTHASRAFLTEQKFTEGLTKH